MPAFRYKLAAIAGLAVFIVSLALAGSHPLHAATGPSSSSVLSPLAQQGKRIFGFTPKYAAAWTGNTLSGTDCHLMDGTVPHAAPLANIANLFPAYSKRAGHVITLEQRIQECFVRSENGRPLPVTSPQMKALVAYMQYLSQDGVKGRSSPGRGLVPLPALTGDSSRGRAVYIAKCAACHQPSGAGVAGAYPPVWGAEAYNTGAGMHRVPVMAAWVQHNMPLDHPGSLTPQQSYDVAAYIDQQPHPEFNPAYKHY
uniref:C-type cytochrome n=1 Tax=Acidobacterium capsulatum TaxID=33075 RepID=A0A7V5CU07_9BACT